jgi:acyl carrier protein
MVPTKNKSSMDGNRERHGLFRAGASKRPRIRRPSIEYSVRPQARIVGHLTCSGLVKFRPHCGFLLRAIHIAQQCGPFATYRRVSCLSASTICGCITAHRSDDWRAESTRATLRSGFHSPLPVLYRFGGLIMTIASLKSSQKATATRGVLASNDVRTLIANQLDVDVKHVTDEAHFTDDLGADWLDRLELMIVIEDRFADVVMTDEDVDQLEVVGDLIPPHRKRGS